MKYLLDTNIVLRFSNPSDNQHVMAVNAVSYLLSQAHECFLAPQVLIEFWVVDTRPVDVNGLGWRTEKTRKIIDQFIDRFPLVDESYDIFPHWLELVTTYKIKGKHTHDARIGAVMLSYGITHLLTFNPSDFEKISGITTVIPHELVTE